MQLAPVNTGVTISSGVEDSEEFTIEADGKMFRMLSDQMYENKIGSVVREVCSNAYDAHIEAGKGDIPFVVHLPTRYEPYFTVTDQGVGMSDDQVKKVFTRFGKSTKDTSNQAVGAFGVGSKSPFAYTNSFTVTAIKDGIRNVYAAVIGDEGKPRMDRLAPAEETTEPNGVEISIAVESWDVDSFADELSHQLRYFKVKPILTGRKIEFKNPMQTVFESIDDHTHLRRSGGIEVVQGGVAYPVNVSQLVKALDGKQERPESLRRFLNNAINQFNPVFHFDIGQIQVSMSREAISYDNTTVNRILDRLQEVQAILLQRILDKMDAASTVWEKTRTLRQNMFLANKLFDLQGNPWGVSCFGTDAVIELPKGYYDDINTGNGKIRHRLTYYTEHTTRGGNFRLASKDCPDNIVPIDDVVIVMDDGCGYHASRLRRYISETGNNVYFFHAQWAELASARMTENLDGTPHLREIFHNWVQGNMDPAMVSNILDKVDGAKIILLSDLPKEERQTVIKLDDGTETIRPKYVPAKTYRFHSFRADNTFSTFKNYEKIFVSPKKVDEEVAYVSVERRTIDLGIDTEQYHLLRFLWKEEAFPMPIYALREKDIAKIQGNPKWNPLKNVLEILKAEYYKKYKFSHVRYAFQRAGDDGYSSFVDEYVSNYMIEHRNEILDPEFVRVLESMEKHKNKMNVNDPICVYFYGQRIDAIREHIKQKNRGRQQRIHARYPLLYMLNRYNSHEAVLPDIIDMINGKYLRLTKSTGQSNGTSV